MPASFMKPWIFVRKERGTYIEPMGTRRAGQVRFSRQDWTVIAQALVAKRLVVYDGQFLLNFIDNADRRKALSARNGKAVSGALYRPSEFSFQAVPIKLFRPVLAEGLTPPLSAIAKAAHAEAVARENTQAHMHLLSTGRQSPSLT